MSVRAISRVLDSSQHAGTELLMLVVLADYSDDDGNSYPSVASLARKCRMSPRNANYLLGALQASGELRVLKNAGPRGTNRFQIQLAKLGKATPAAPATPDADCTTEAGFTLKPTSPTPEAGFPKPLKPIAPEPSFNHQKPNTSVAKATAGKPAGSDHPSDRDLIFALGVPLLVEFGQKESTARSFLGLQIKACGERALVEALKRCAVERPIQAVAWLAANLKPKASRHAGFAFKDYRHGVAEDGSIVER